MFDYTSSLNIEFGGLVLMAPCSRPPPTLFFARALLCLPDIVFELLRWWDRRGGLYSNSVSRWHGDRDVPLIRQKQLMWNISSRTTTFRRFLRGTERHDILWSAIRCPVILVGGEHDKVVSEKDMDEIQVQVTSATCKTAFIKGVGHQMMVEAPDTINEHIRSLLK
jgi:pimeloyl-ACP methyl ester carboxylesterase